ncbi:hypothetical protein [Variovorax sp.]|uniref:hypothetical protein n=1 Tax=Variovorax sp. TaxID=1871043 RepID=UPI002D775E3E|nr:hypothetical protein [Variovorax sp.]
MPHPTASTSPGEEASADPPLLSGMLALIPLAKSLHDRGLSPPEIKAAMKKALEMHRAKRAAATR